MLRSFLPLFIVTLLLPVAIGWTQDQRSEEQSAEQQQEQKQEQKADEQPSKDQESKVPRALAKPPVKPEFVDRFNKRYLTQEPKVGTVIEWVDGLDESGNEFDSEQIKGKYSVFVFGCLT